MGQAVSAMGKVLARESCVVTDCWGQGGEEAREEWFLPSWEIYDQGLETLLLTWTL